MSDPATEGSDQTYRALIRAPEGRAVDVQYADGTSHTLLAVSPVRGESESRDRLYELLSHECPVFIYQSDSGECVADIILASEIPSGGDVSSQIETKLVQNVTW
jgi:hypothetical protein